MAVCMIRLAQILSAIFFLLALARSLRSSNSLNMAVTSRCCDVNSSMASCCLFALVIAYPLVLLVDGGASATVPAWRESARQYVRERTQAARVLCVRRQGTNCCMIWETFNRCQDDRTGPSAPRPGART